MSHAARLLVALCGFFLTLPAAAADKKIVLIAGKPSHGWGSHEHKAGCLLLANALNRANIGVRAEVVTDGWPTDERIFDDAAAIVMYCDGGKNHMANAHLPTLRRLIDKGVGVGAIHYAVETPAGEEGKTFLDAFGGYFEMNWSVNPHWTADFKTLPDHPITRGVKPFDIQDEWYYHMRFREAMKNVRPILTDLPGPQTLTRKDGPHSGNPAVRTAVLDRKEPQHVMWASENVGGGRGFGFTGGHFHWNWGHDQFRKVVLNAIAWSAGIEVPAEGVKSKTPTAADLEANQDEPRPASWNARKIQDMLDRWNTAAPAPAAGASPAPVPTAAPADDAPVRSLGEALSNLDVADGLHAALFSGEPHTLNPTAIDIDDRGRVWVTEVMNYRRFANKNNPDRPAGDRILILEDTDGDAKADKSTVFYQGRDIDAAHGVTLIGDKVYVATPDNKLLVFTDADGDDRPEHKTLLLQGREGQQHDHGYHTVNFGPDGKVYWNFGNNGGEVRDTAGNIVLDAAGNPVTDAGKPYRQGLVIRMNPDGSGLQTVGHNFRNNWEVNLDSFGTMWQSDNDDDGNRGVRINYVMPYGNYGYTDEMTGAGWRTPRTNLEDDIPLRHWHLNDPGVVPNLLQTGGGSPTGLIVYEGHLLPERFRGQVIHCDAGPNVVRAYPVSKSGAGYTAQVAPILTGTRDKWFRPSDVSVAPDGSLIVADWYDPGVGGHRQGDVDRGRLFRVAPPDAAYKFPRPDYSSPESAAAALRSANQATRAKAWLALHRMGDNATAALTKLWRDANPRHRARALHLLARIPGQARPWIDAAVADADEDIRVTGVRLAVDLLGDATPLVASLANDASPQVRRECALALRFAKGPAAAEAWAHLAARHDGKDRWYLEALGIGADLDWPARFAAWRKLAGEKWNTPAGRDIVWRARTDAALPLLNRLITDPATSGSDRLRYFRAFDFHTGPAREQALTALLTGSAGDQAALTALALKHLQDVDAGDPQIKAALDRGLKAVAGTQEFVDLIDRFKLQGYTDELLEIAFKSADASLAAAATQQLLKGKSRQRVQAILADDKTAPAMLNALSLVSDNNQALGMLQGVVLDARREVALRTASVRAMGRGASGQRWLLQLARDGKLPSELQAPAADALFASYRSEWREEAAQYLKMPGSGSGKPLPSIAQLVKRKGDAKNGQAVFARSCIACHKVNGSGIDFGPDLSEIGTKLPREDLYVAIINPSAGISFGYEGYALKLRNGGEVVGYIAGETASELTLRIMGGVSMKYKKDDIQQRTRQEMSLMPPGLQAMMSEQELVDLVEHLTTLRKAVR